MNENHRPTGTAIHLLDTDKLKKLVTDVAIENGKPGANDHVEPDRLALVMDRDENFYVLCTEGVGWHADENGMMLIPCSTGMSWCEFEFRLGDVIDCISEETVELAEFVRTFGSRLESNFGLWYDKLHKVPQTILQTA